MKNVKKFWDQQAERFSRSEQTELQSILDMSEKYFDETDVILDFGCAAGYSSIHLSSRVDQVVGVDYSPEMIRRAKENAVNSKVDNVSFVVSALEPDKEFDTSFTGIVAFNVFHLLDHLDEVLNKMYSLIDDGGVLISYTPCIGEGSAVVRALTGFMAKIGNFPTVHRLSGQDLKAVIEETGFKVLESTGYEDVAHSHFIVAKK